MLYPRFGAVAAIFITSFKSIIVALISPHAYIILNYLVWGLHHYKKRLPTQLWSCCLQLMIFKRQPNLLSSFQSYFRANITRILQHQLKRKDCHYSRNWHHLLSLLQIWGCLPFLKIGNVNILLIQNLEFCLRLVLLDIMDSHSILMWYK